MSDPKRIDALLLEYEKLKEEQIARIDLRDNFIYASIAATGGALGFGLTQAEADLVFFVLPIVNFSLGWTYLSNDLKITTIGRYLRRASDELAGPDAFGWEAHHVALSGRRRRKVYQLIVDLAVFPAAGLLGLAYGFGNADFGLLVALLGLVGVVLCLALAFEFIRASPLVDADGLNS